MSKLTSALAYAAAGLRVFPLYGTDGETCDCGKADCENQGKHPCTSRGFKDASSDPVQIRSWWKKFPNANIGMPTGEVNGIVVMDVDTRHGGDKSWEGLCKVNNYTPDTLCAETGGGGFHYFFRADGRGIRNSAGVVGDGIDVRGDGGYVVIPPSIHKSGATYRWASGPSFDREALRPLPDWLIQRLAETKGARPCGGGDGAIPQGQRNNTLFRNAISLRRLRVDLVAALATINSMNDSRCSPPLPHSEVDHIVRQAYGYTLQYDNLCTDVGNANRLVLRHGRDLRYCNLWKSWIYWDGWRWRKDDSGEVVRRAKETALSIREEAEHSNNKEDRDRLFKWAARSEMKTHIDGMIGLARAELSIQPEELDSDLWLLCVENGTIDLRTGEFREHCRSNLISKMANVALDPKAKCPKFEHFISQVCAGNSELITYIQKLMGYALTGETSDQSFYILYGRGANGKTTLIEIILSILGDYGGKTPMATFLAKNGDHIRNDVAALRGVRCVAASEIGMDRHIDEPLLKEMTGGDMVCARFLFGEFFSYKPQCKIILATNHKSAIRGSDVGIWRRVKVVPFDVTIPENKRDPHLVKKLLEEGSGILNWMLEGLKAYVRDGRVTEPECIREAVGAYRAEMDIVGDFLEAQFMQKPGLYVPASVVWKEYLKWCEENGEQPVTQRTLGTIMTERGFHRAMKSIGGKSVRVYLGLVVRPAPF